MVFDILCGIWNNVFIGFDILWINVIDVLENVILVCKEVIIIVFFVFILCLFLYVICKYFIIFLIVERVSIFVSGCENLEI